MAKDHVRSFANGMHWSTHRCINRSLGHWKDSKKTEHNWNANLAHDLTTHMLPHWNKTFDILIPKEQAAFIQKAKELISEFATIVADTSLSADVAAALSILKDHILRNQDLLQTSSEDVFEHITEAYRRAHRSMVPAIKGFLAPMYNTCGSEHGNGHFQRNRELHVKWMRTKGRQMHHVASEAVIDSLDDMLNSLPNTLQAAYQDPLQDIKDQITRFFGENTASGSRTSGRKVVSNAKVNLRNAILVHVNKLAQAWISGDSAVPAAEEDDDEDAMLFDNSDLYDVGGKDQEGDANYEDNQDDA